MHKRQGFTLIEILIVIAIIAVLAAILSIAVSGILGAGPQKKTAAILNSIKVSLQEWSASKGSGVWPTQASWADFDGTDVSSAPPDGKTGTLDSSRAELLYHLLCERRIINPATGEDKPPIMPENSVTVGDYDGDYKMEIWDAWSQPIQYRFPGVDRSVVNAGGSPEWPDRVGKPGANHASATDPQPDIWSVGDNGYTDDKGKHEDDVTNWWN